MRAKEGFAGVYGRIVQKHGPGKLIIEVLDAGLDHGLFCLGCCWAIMGLLFVGGVMNLLVVAAIAGFVLLEKVMPRGDLVGRPAGCLLVLAGIWLIVQA